MGENIEALNAKIASAEKSKHRLESELEEVSMEYERTHAAAIITEKRGKNFEKVVGEWKAKADDMQTELEASHSECRNLNAEQFRLKSALEETSEQLDIVRRENKNLADEIKDLLDQLGDGGRSIHDLDKQRRRLEVEKEELQAALEEAEGALEAEENKVLRAQLELGQVRQEIDRRMAEKAKKAMVDAARLADELRAEQDHVSTQANAKRALETQMGELEQRLADANENAMRGGRAAMAKLESRIKSLRSSLETFRPTPLRARRDTRRLSARSRS